MEAVNWIHIYAERDSSQDFIRLCDDYEQNRFKWDRHTKDISLRGFVTYFNKNWTLSNKETFPIFTPALHFLGKKTSKSYQNQCRYILLSEKPGFYITNVQTNFESHEEELKDFVNSQYCPALIREQFQQSQVEDDEQNSTEDEDDEVDALILSPLDNSDEQEIIPTQFQINQLHEDYDHAHEIYDDGTMEYDSEEFRANTFSHNWSLDRELLHNDMSENHLDSATHWIENRKLHHTIVESKENINHHDLKPAQRKFYDYVTNWIIHKIEDSKVPPIYAVLSGRAGCGKTFAVKCVNNFINKNEKCLTGFLKIAAPTGTAAFLIKGTTLHSCFKLPVNVNFKEDLASLQGPILQQLQEIFKDTEIIMIDEMSMVGKYMLYQLSQRLKEVKPQHATQEFAGVSIILMGDFAQLPPVADLPLFAKKGGTVYQTKGKALYRLFNKAFFLTEYEATGE